jgi:phage gp45-like
MNMMLIRDLAAKLRNLFCVSELQKRYDDGKVQIKTHNGKVLEKCESFPYGFYAKAKNGKALVFCQGGNYNDFEILPVMKADDISAPELQKGDTALYTGDGGWIIARDNGKLELFGTDAGGVVKAAELERQLNKLSARVDGIMDALKKSQTAVQDGGAAYKAQIAAMLATLIDKEDFSNLESEKVLHGTGK